MQSIVKYILYIMAGVALLTGLKVVIGGAVQFNMKQRGIRNPRIVGCSYSSVVSWLNI